jgi:hypothetical protein
MNLSTVQSSNALNGLSANEYAKLTEMHAQRLIALMKLTDKTRKALKQLEKNQGDINAIPVNIEVKNSNTNKTRRNQDAGFLQNQNSVYCWPNNSNDTDLQMENNPVHGAILTAGKHQQEEGSDWYCWQKDQQQQQKPIKSWNKTSSQSRQAMRRHSLMSSYSGISSIGAEGLNLENFYLDTDIEFSTKEEDELPLEDTEVEVHRQLLSSKKRSFSISHEEYNSSSCSSDSFDGNSVNSSTDSLVSACSYNKESFYKKESIEEMEYHAQYCSSESRQSSKRRSFYPQTMEDPSRMEFLY